MQGGVLVEDVCRYVGRYVIQLLRRRAVAGYFPCSCVSGFDGDGKGCGEGRVCGVFFWLNGLIWFCFA